MKKFKYLFISICFLFCFIVSINNVEALSYGRVSNSSGVNLRTGPSTSYSKSGKLLYNDVVPLISSISYKGTGCTSGWYKINYNNETRYVCKNYITTSNYTIKVNYASGINIRTGAGTNYSIYQKAEDKKLLSLHSTTKYNGNGCSNGWYKIDLDNSNKYVCSNYINNYNSNSNIIITNLSGVNLREKASSTSTKITSLKYGYALTLNTSSKYKGNGCPSDWYEVNYNGKIAYICSTYTHKSKNTAIITNLTGGTLRNEASNTSLKYKTLSYGTVLALSSTTKYPGTGCAGTWNKVNVNTKNYYICSNDISTSTISTNINTNGTNIRTGAGTGYSKITSLEKNALVFLNNTTKHIGAGCTSGWYELSLNGKTGYVCSAYTELGKSTTTTATTTNKTVSKLSLGSGSYYYSTNKWTYRVSEDYINVRKTGSSSGTYIESIYLGTEVKPLLISGNYTKVSYYNGKTGYVLTTGIEKYSEVTKNNATYCNTLKNKGFPESYCPYLSYIHSKHPNWVFTPEKTNLYFKNAVLGESKKNFTQIYDSALGGKNNINTAYLNSTTLSESGGWRTASDAYIAYMLDPRVYLNEKNLFVFENLSYDSKNQTKEIVKSIFDGTYLESDTYVNYFINAASKYNISPVHLASRVKQEGGSNKNYYPITGTVTDTWNVTSNNYGYICSDFGSKSGDYLKLISGSINVRSGASTKNAILKYPNGKPITANSKDTIKISSTTLLKGDGCTNGWYKVKVYKSLKGIYNYYNIGAYGSNPVLRGLAAAAGYVDDLDGIPWNTREKAIQYGAKFIADGYIAAGQNTLYYQKFNTGPNAEATTYTHQYMTNILAPASESLSTYYSYKELGLLNKSLAFKIPVYKSLPAFTSHPPVGGISAHLNALK